MRSAKTPAGYEMLHRRRYEGIEADARVAAFAAPSTA